MDWKNLLQAALTLVVAFAVRWFFGLIGFELDDELFVTLVGAIVAWLLGLFGVNVSNALIEKAGFRGFLPK